MSGYYGDAYLANSHGRLWVVDTDPGAAVPALVGAPAFSLMTPIVILRNPITSAQRATIKEFFLHQENTPSAQIHVRAMLDRADTYVTMSGIQRTPHLPNGSYLTEPTLNVQVYDEEPDLEDTGFVDGNGNTSAPFGCGLRSIAVGDGDVEGTPVGGGIIVNPGQTCAFYAWNSGATQVTCNYQLRFLVDAIRS